MTSTELRRKAILLLLASFLAFPWAASAGPRPEGARAVAPTALTLLDNLFGRAWGLLTDVRNKTGCYIDPSGLFCAPVASQPAIETDAGCYIDPSGGCRD